MVWFTKIEHLW